MKFNTLLTILLTSAGCASPQLKTVKPTIDPKVAFAECLVEEGFTLYLAEYCFACEKQKEYFGPAWEIIEKNSTNCGNYLGMLVGSEDLSELCEEMVGGFPEWTFADGKTVNGTLTLEQLQSYSQCSYNQQ